MVGQTWRKSFNYYQSLVKKKVVWTLRWRIVDCTWSRNMKDIVVKTRERQLTVPFSLLVRQTTSFILILVLIATLHIAKVWITGRCLHSIQRLVFIFLSLRLRLGRWTVWWNWWPDSNNHRRRNQRWVTVRFPAGVGEYLPTDGSSASCGPARTTKEELYWSNGWYHSVSDCGLVTEDTSTAI